MKVAGTDQRKQWHKQLYFSCSFLTQDLLYRDCIFRVQKNFYLETRHWKCFVGFLFPVVRLLFVH